jgi:glutaredoxin 3
MAQEAAERWRGPSEGDSGKAEYPLTMVYIYGKDSCPYTQAARDDYARRGILFEYIDVKKDAAALHRMLELSAGRRCVPVIDDHGQVIVGFGGT